MNSNIVKKNMYLISIVLSITILLISISVSLIFNDFDYVKKYNQMFLENNVKVIIEDNKEEIINDIASNEEVAIMSENSNFLNGAITKGILFSEEKIEIPVNEGRNLEEEDLKDNNKFIIIGSEFKDLIKIKNNKKYINVFGDEYEVIGISENDILKYNIFVNLNIIDDKDRGENYVICSNKLSAKELFNMVYRYQEKYENSINILDLKQEKYTLDHVIERYSEVIKNYVVLMIISFLALFITTLYYINKIKLEIYITSLCGATKLDIFKLLSKKFSIISSISFIISIILQTIIIIIPKSNIGHYEFSIYNFYFMFLCYIIFAIFIYVNYIYLRKKYSICTAIKEG